MTKLWKPTAPKSDKVIMLYQQSVYKGNPNEVILHSIYSVTQADELAKSLFGIPYSYIKKIINQQGLPYIKIHFGRGSEEELNISNEHLKNEIFNCLKQDLSKLKFRSEVPSIFKYAKAQIFGILISSGIFAWAMYLAIQMANGTTFELVGGRPGLTGIVLALANFGIPVLLIGYSLILGIALLSLLRKLKTRSETQILER